jgi:hypothetical protein
MATTGPRDAGLQESVRWENEKRKHDGTFQIGLWFWEDFVGFNNNDSNLMKWYADYSENIHGAELHDRQILAVMRMAFARAAFRTPMTIETPAELRDALLDTLRAVNTGLLLDRETRLPICRAPSGISGLREDRVGRCEVIITAVHKARALLDAALADGRVVQCGSCLLPHDHRILTSIDRQRGLALQALNLLLDEFYAIISAW